MHPTIQALEAALTPDAHALFTAAVTAAETVAAPLYLVGGAVRDLAAGRPLRDIDVSTPTDPAMLAHAIAAAAGAEARVEPRFGTAALTRGAARLDLSRWRSERYPRPGTLPIVRFGATLAQDLARRDFSVNAVALGATHAVRDELHDPHHGLADLAAGRLRVLHDRSFRDDATRLWRAARYAARLRLRPDPPTAALIADAGRWLSAISGTRLRAELAQLAAEPRPLVALRLLDAWGVLAASAPGCTLTAASAAALARRGPLPLELLAATLLAPLPAAAREAALARFAAPATVTRAVEGAAALLAARDRDPAALTALAATSPAARAAARALDPAAQRPLQAALRRWEATRSPLDARALLRLGVPAGPPLGRALDRLRRERYLGTLHDAGAARRLALALAHEQPAAPPASERRRR